MARTYRYRLQNAPEGSIDGSGVVLHDIFAEYSDDQVDYLDVPGYHKTFAMPAAEVGPVMDMPDSTGPQRQAKNQAYKDLMVTYWGYQPIPTQFPQSGDWSPDGLDEYMSAYDAAVAARDAANAEAATEAARINEYITVTLGQAYPVSFNLEA